MYNEWFSHMNKSLHNISFSLKVQMVQAKVNLYLSLPIGNLIFYVKYKRWKSIINNYSVLDTHISTRKSGLEI